MSGFRAAAQLARAAIIVAMVAALAPTAHAAGSAQLPSNEWSTAARPSAGPAQAIGGAAHGCLAGAVALPVDGVGYQAIRLSRHRIYGHPDLVAFIEHLGSEAAAAGLPAFYVGDMAQPRGGPLPYGHASHQTGIDVDIWFRLDAHATLPSAAREELALPSMVTRDQHHIDAKRFGARQLSLLELAASDPRVDRIFVHPAIKAALCRSRGRSPGAVWDWLRRLRPWYGHDDHFHVRLACPAGSPECEAQAPVPPGDGCDASLAQWLQHPLPPLVPTTHPPPPHSHLPAACSAVLTAPDPAPASLR
jgi:penicillin-insensitive murein endopeptidase